MAKRPTKRAGAKQPVGLEQVAAALDTIERQLADIWMVLAAMASWELACQWKGDWPGVPCGIPPLTLAEQQKKIAGAQKAGAQKVGAPAFGIPWPPPPAIICRVPPANTCMGVPPGKICAEPVGPIVPEQVMKPAAKKAVKKAAKKV